MAQVTGFIEHLLVEKKVKTVLPLLNYLGLYILKEINHGEMNKMLS
jgi:hypothetical protein